MKIRNIILAISAVGILAGVCPAATVPAETTIVVTTTTTISSKDGAGKPFEGRLLQNVEVKGNVALAKDTAVRGVVESPRVNIASSTRPLTLKLTHVSIHGRMVPIKTQSLETEASGVKSRRGVRLTGSAFLLPPGTKLEFKLLQPLNF